MFLERGRWVASLVWLVCSACTSTSGKAGANKADTENASETSERAASGESTRSDRPQEAPGGDSTADTDEHDAGIGEPETTPIIPGRSESLPGSKEGDGAAGKSGTASNAGASAVNAAGGPAMSNAAGGPAMSNAAGGPAMSNAAGGPASSGAGGAGGSGGPAPRDTPATQEKLGKRLFEDKNLSSSGTQSCASCHDAEHAFTGSADALRPDFPVAKGAQPEQLGNRNVPTAMYMRFSPPFAFVQDDEGEWVPTGGQFWDGRVNNLSEQAAGPFLNPREMAMPSKQAVIDSVRKADYAWMFEELFGMSAFEDIEAAYTRVTDAIAAYEETDVFSPFTSKFDAYLRGETALSEQESLGFELFKDETKGNCIGCHAGDPDSKDPRDWLFTDFTYDNLGVPRNADIPDNKQADSYDLGLCASDVLVGRLPEEVTDRDAFIEGFCGAFKVPTLRNVARTAPYMHNGYFKKLRDVVDFYVTRDTDAGRWYPMAADGTLEQFNDLPAAYKSNVNTEEVPYDRKPGEQPRLSPTEIDALVAFLMTLSDGYQAARAP